MDRVKQLSEEDKTDSAKLREAKELLEKVDDVEEESYGPQRMTTAVRPEPLRFPERARSPPERARSPILPPVVRSTSQALISAPGPIKRPTPFRSGTEGQPARCPQCHDNLDDQPDDLAFCPECGYSFSSTRHAEASEPGPAASHTSSQPPVLTMLQQKQEEQKVINSMTESATQHPLFRNISAAQGICTLTASLSAVGRPLTWRAVAAALTSRSLNHGRLRLLCRYLQHRH